MDPEMTEDDVRELREAEKIVRNLLQADLDADEEDGTPLSAIGKLAAILGEEYIHEVDEVVPVPRARA